MRLYRFFIYTYSAVYDHNISARVKAGLNSHIIQQSKVFPNLSAGKKFSTFLLFFLNTNKRPPVKTVVLQTLKGV